MPKATPISTLEREFILSAMKLGQRVDGRSPYDLRTINIVFGQKPGVVQLQLGRSRVLAVVSGEVVKPFPDRANEGILQFQVGFAEMSDPSVDNSSRASERAVEVHRVVEKSIRESRAVDTEALCIIPGEKVWSIRCDVHILDNEGNVIDCAVMAAITALLAYRRPDVTVVGGELTVHAMDEKQPVPLAIHHIPVAFTFAFFPSPATVVATSNPAAAAASASKAPSGDEDDSMNGGASSSSSSSSSSVFSREEIFLCAIDPSRKEEQVMSGSMTITLNAHREVCCIHKPGGRPLAISQFLECQSVAAAKVAEVTQVIRHALQANNLTPKQRQALLLARKGKAPSSASTATSSSSSGSSEAAAIAWKGVGVAPVSSESSGGPTLVSRPPKAIDSMEEEEFADVQGQVKRQKAVAGSGQQGLKTEVDDEELEDVDALAESLSLSSSSSSSSSSYTSSTTAAASANSGWFSGGGQSSSLSKPGKVTAWEDDGDDDNEDAESTEVKPQARAKTVVQATATDGALSDDEEEESTSVVTSEFATAAPASVLKPKSAFQADQMRSAADKVKTGGANLAAAVKPKPGGKGAKK